MSTEIKPAEWTLKAAREMNAVDLLALVSPLMADRDKGVREIATIIAKHSPSVPEQASLKNPLFDGWSVFQEIGNDPRAAARTSAENVSDVLDAVVRILRAEKKVAGQG